MSGWDIALFFSGQFIVIGISYFLGAKNTIEKAIVHTINEMVEAGLLQIKMVNGEEVIYSGYKTPENDK